MLGDPDLLVPEADAASERANERFRSASSRFVNGERHDLRRRWIEERLAALDVSALAETAAALTRRAGSTPSHVIARTVPVECLAAQLGFADPPALPRLVAAVAAAYPTGEASDAADAAAARLLAAAPVAAITTTTTSTSSLDVQLLVQAHLATAALIEGALRAVHDEPSLGTSAALLRTLHRTPPVPATRRIRPDGEVLLLPLTELEAAHAGGTESTPPLAFGAGDRACPAPAHAFAISAAVVGVLRERGRARASDAASDHARTSHDGSLR